jgi:selenocysteine-specific elongation factor
VNTVLPMLRFCHGRHPGRGIDALRDHLQHLTSREHASHHRFRLAIDRAFTVKGAGLVVTGTALSGEVSVGDTYG